MCIQDVRGKSKQGALSEFPSLTLVCACRMSEDAKDQDRQFKGGDAEDEDDTTSEYFEAQVDQEVARLRAQLGMGHEVCVGVVKR
eukprot:1152549-Pelagomonas_calceolata.AAC.1